MSHALRTYAMTILLEAYHPAESIATEGNLIDAYRIEYRGKRIETEPVSEKLNEATHIFQQELNKVALPENTVPPDQPVVQNIEAPEIVTDKIAHRVLTREYRLKVHTNLSTLAVREAFDKANERLQQFYPQETIQPPPPEPIVNPLPAKLVEQAKWEHDPDFDPARDIETNLEPADDDLIQDVLALLPKARETSNVIPPPIVFEPLALTDFKMVKGQTVSR